MWIHGAIIFNNNKMKKYLMILGVVIISGTTNVFAVSPESVGIVPELAATSTTPLIITASTTSPALITIESSPIPLISPLVASTPGFDNTRFGSEVNLWNSTFTETNSTSTTFCNGHQWDGTYNGLITLGVLF